MIGYLRVSTDEQADSGGGLSAQRERIGEEAARRGWTISEWCVDEGFSGKDTRRPGLQDALERCGAGEADGIIVAKLDRLSRSVYDTSGMMADALAQKWVLVSLDPQVDMTTAYGKAMAQMAMVFAELERELIATRTREAMQALIAQDHAEGLPSRFGPKVQVSRAVEERILSMARRKVSQSDIARTLNRDGFTNAAGNPWTQSSVWKVLDRCLNGRKRAPRAA